MSPKIGYPLMVIWILACLWGFTYLGEVVMGLTITSVWAFPLMITGTVIVVAGVLWIDYLIDQYKERRKNEFDR